MNRFSALIRLSLACLLLGWAGLLLGLPAEAAPIPARTIPQAAEGPNSLNNPVNRFPADIRFQPYNQGDNELNLWGLESNRFARSPMVVSPDFQALAYSEVMFMPDARQTFSRLYIVPLPEMPMPGSSQLYRSQMGSTLAAPSAKQPPDSRLYSTWFDPNQTLKLRQLVTGVGDGKTVRHAFQTLTIVDWSATGQRLLFKERSGVLHVGLQTTDILVYDRQQGTVTIYPELKRTLAYTYEKRRKEFSLPPVDRATLELDVLGWEIGSDSKVLFRGWALDKSARLFLGLWRYDVEMQRADFISPVDLEVSVAANGAVPVLPPKPTEWHAGMKPPKKPKPPKPLKPPKQDDDPTWRDKVPFLKKRPSPPPEDVIEPLR